MKERTYEEVYKEWGNSRYKSVSYKDEELKITAFQEVRNFPLPVFDRVFYIGELEFYKKGEYNSSRTSFESIHYDKVVSRFQRFVDEYCTDWVVFSNFQYKGYRVFINKEKDKDFYIGIVQFHKNSTYKHIADTREEVERCCKNRIDRVIYEKEKMKNVTKPEFVDTYSYKGYELEITYEPTMSYPYLGKEPYVGRIHELLLSWRDKTPEGLKKEFRDYFDEKGIDRTVEKETEQIKILTPKQEKIQELEQLQARISTQLEELKKEKDTLTYKGVVLEIDTEPNGSIRGGRIKNPALDLYVKLFKEDNVEDLRRSFETYIDMLEGYANIYSLLTGK